MKIIDFVQGFKDKKIMNTKVDTDAVGKFQMSVVWQFASGLHKSLAE